MILTNKVRGQMNWQEDVRDFHDKFGLPYKDSPGIPRDPVVILLRQNLIAEEAEELENAMCDDDLVQIAKEAADLIYVTLGMCETYGINMEKVWDEVHESNMKKGGGATRIDGKVLKPNNWTPPDIAGVLGLEPATTKATTAEPTTSEST